MDLLRKHGIYHNLIDDLDAFDNHVNNLFEMNESNFFFDAFEIEEIGVRSFLNTFVFRNFLLRIIFEPQA